MKGLLYNDLTIHQKINSKAHFLIFYPGSCGGPKPLIRLVNKKIAGFMFPYNLMFLENPGLHNNRHL